MGRPLFIIFVLLVLAILPERAFAGKAYVLSGDASGESVNAHVDVYIDKTGQATLSDILQSADFQPTNGVAGVGVVPGAVWLRVKLTRTVTAPPIWWLELSPMAAAEVMFFEPAGDGEYERHVAGDNYAFSQRTFPYRQYIYRVDVPIDRSETFYFRVTAHNGTIFPLRVWQFEHFAERSMVEYVFLGVCFGVMAGLCLYNLLLYFRLRDILFLLYFGVTGSFMLFAADLIGLASHVLWADHGWLSDSRNQALIALWGGLISWFAMLLLQDDDGSPWLVRIMSAAMIMYGIGFFVALAGQPLISGMISNLSPLITIPTGLYYAIRQARRGFIAATYYLCGYGAVLVGITLLLLRGNGVVDATPFTGLFFVAAGAFEAILFSQALAERVNLLKEQREDAQARLLSEEIARAEETRRHRDTLELRVAERTAELKCEIEGHKQTAEQLRASQDKLVHLAYFDALTNLPNRRLFLDRFDHAAALAKRDGPPFCLLLIDLDKFKLINDRYGHDAGDALLIEASRRFQSCLRDTDTLARLGGDEFAIILAGPIDRAACEIVCKRLIEAFLTNIDFKEVKLHTSPSIGVAWFGPDGSDFTALYKAADLALYGAKQAGRNCYRFYDSLVLS